MKKRSAADKFIDSEKNPLLGRIFENLSTRPAPVPAHNLSDIVKDGFEIVRPLDPALAKLFKGSVNMREVDTGSCGACELEIAALAYPQYDMERFGFNIVASPRHADLFLITGCATTNMAAAARLTFEAAPKPCLYVAVGDCACGKGPFRESYATLGSADRLADIDLKIFGCPPDPLRIISALITFLQGRQRGSYKQGTHTDK